MYTNKHLFQVILACYSILILSSCIKSTDPNILHGSTYNYRPGYPEVRLSAIGFIDRNENTKIRLVAEIVYGSLVYRQINNRYKARVKLDLLLIEKSGEFNKSTNKNFTFNLESQKKSVVYSQDVYTFAKNIDVPPGEYDIILTVVDANSDKETTRRTETSIPNPNAEVSHLTNIRMLTKTGGEDNDQFKATPTYDIPETVDSLKFIFQVTNNQPNKPVTITSRLIRFESDTSIARPMNYQNYPPGSLPDKGVDYGQQEIIQSSRRTLTQPGSVLIEFTFANLERGNYRFEAETDELEEGSKYKARDFGVKSPNYPALKTPRELARPLYYLMQNREYEDLISISDPDSLKSAIDRFWLRHLGNKTNAKSVLELYYHRVEEANKQFSNYKEGWKTDPGMIYILFGSPWYIATNHDRMQWSYSYDFSDPERTFLFTKPRFKNKFYPFNYYILERSDHYFNIQYQQVQLWLNGQISGVGSGVLERYILNRY